MGSTMTVSCYMQDHWTRASGVRGTAGCNLERMSWGCVYVRAASFLHLAFSCLEDLLNDFGCFFLFSNWAKVCMT